MARFQFWAALALLGLNTVSVVADGSCVPTCVNEKQNNNFKDFGCVAADQAGCLCRSEGFINLVADCSKSCNPTVDEFREGLLGNAPPRFCVGIPAGEVPNAKNLASPSSAAPASTSTPASTAPPSTSSTPSPSSTSSPVSTSTTLATSTTSGTPTTSSASSSGSTTSSHTSTSTSAAAGETTSAAATPTPASGISSGAAAGIGIGVAIVVVAVAVIAFCLLRKRKSQAPPRHSMEISKPLPGSGRTYPARDDGDRDSFDKYGNDIEMTSNRYEDMVPSQQPRTMV